MQNHSQILQAAFSEHSNVSKQCLRYSETPECMGCGSGRQHNKMTFLTTLRSHAEICKAVWKAQLGYLSEGADEQGML